MGGRKFVLGLIFGKERGHQMHSTWRAKGIEKLPDRQLMVNSYLPAFAAEGGNILWVGCQEYTADYTKFLEREGGRVWSTDIDPDAARWGHPDRHRTGDICKADQLFADVRFDSILFNGVLGFGVNAQEQQRQAFSALAAIVRPGGRLLVGWNSDKIADPIAAGLASPWFATAPFAGLSPRQTFPKHTHVYDVLARNSAQPASD